MKKLSWGTGGCEAIKRVVDVEEGERRRIGCLTVIGRT
jgi:hypothetical protein